MSLDRSGPTAPSDLNRLVERWLPGLCTVVVIGTVIGVTLWQLHPSLLFSNTTTTGGDTGAHLALPKYLQTLLSHGHLAGWDPGWYDGFSLYTFYFALPDLFAAIGGWIIPFNIAFKLVTILGSVLLPICAWSMGRLFRLRPPIPAALAALTLPFLFDYTYTIYGGNLFSTLAGEYAFSFSLSLALLFLGFFARAVREGKYRVWAAIVLAACILSHIIPAGYALVGAALLTAVELLPAKLALSDRAGSSFWRDTATPQIARSSVGRRVWWGCSTVGLGILLSGWWLVPFGLNQSYATSMNYGNVTTYWSLLFPEADAWALVIAGLALVLAVMVRSRFGLVVTAAGTIAALAMVFDPQGSLYNVRLLPLWFMSVYLMTGWGIGIGCILIAEAWRTSRARRWAGMPEPAPWEDGPPPQRPWEAPRTTAQILASQSGRLLPRPGQPRWGPAALSGAVVSLLVVLVVVVSPFVLPNDIPATVGANQVTNWSNYNYMGYQGQTSYPEYKALIDTVQHATKRYGCGRAMWEYSDSENRFGTPEALMLLPYWTNGCVDSMEGLLFESSATTPYHFIDQAEMSLSPSDPEVGLPYGPLDVTLGVQHLQLLGVKYFMAETSEVEQEANADPALKLIATSGPWTYSYNGAIQHTTWDIYVVRNASLVTPLTHVPAVESGVQAKPSSWLNPSLSWYDHPGRWGVELAQSGPTSWPRTTIGAKDPPRKRVPTTTVSHIATTDSSVSFHVSRTGTPVLVKISYFPNWHAGGADGPWRVTPNLMVVVPTSHTVTLTYGRSGANDLGDLATLLGLGVAGFIAVGWYRMRVRTRAA